MIRHDDPILPGELHNLKFAFFVVPRSADSDKNPENEIIKEIEKIEKVLVTL